MHPLYPRVDPSKRRGISTGRSEPLPESRPCSFNPPPVSHLKDTSLYPQQHFGGISLTSDARVRTIRVSAPDMHARSRCAREVTSGDALEGTVRAGMARETGGIGTHRGEAKSGRDGTLGASTLWSPRVVFKWRTVSRARPFRVEEIAADRGIESRAGASKQWHQVALSQLSSDDDSGQSGGLLDCEQETPAEGGSAGRAYTCVVREELLRLLRVRLLWLLGAGVLGGGGLVLLGVGVLAYAACFSGSLVNLNLHRSPGRDTPESGSSALDSPHSPVSTLDGIVKLEQNISKQQDGCDSLSPHRKSEPNRHVLPPTTFASSLAALSAILAASYFWILALHYSHQLSRLSSVPTGPDSLPSISNTAYSHTPLSFVAVACVLVPAPPAICGASSPPARTRSTPATGAPPPREAGILRTADYSSAQLRARSYAPLPSTHVRPTTRRRPKSRSIAARELLRAARMPAPCGRTYAPDWASSLTPARSIGLFYTTMPSLDRACLFL
ncbi:hypothetical protein DFH09DRAFT_1098882 [Mycena vulgaris]|nr:hypothetical protein DFH09DRAFT_1098882 [Mycena vulgaris]